MRNVPRRYYARERGGKRRVFAFRSFQSRKWALAQYKLTAIAFTTMSEKERTRCLDGYYIGCDRVLGFQPGWD